MKILGLSGSLRAASLNTMLLRAVVRLAPPGVEVSVYPGLGYLPLFNPDIEPFDPPSVADLRGAIIAADALLIASPEYAHGVTGVIKNALDWMVGNESFVNKPVALLSASPRATHAQEALRDTIATMSAQIIDSACVTVPLLGSNLTEDDIVRSPDISVSLVNSLRCLQEEPHKRRAAPASTDVSDRDVIDLSHTIEGGMITYRGLPAPHICDHLSFEASHEVYDEGTEFNIARIDMVANTGTYLDVPYHRYRDGDDLSAVSLERLADLPGRVVRVTGMSERAIDWTVFAAGDVKGHAVLVHTGWDVHWRTEQYYENHPFLTEKAAEYLRDEGAALVGIDSLNIDDISIGKRPVHSVLLGAGTPIVEHMTNLGALPAAAFRFTAAPPRIRAMGTFPVRAHARLNRR